MMITTTAAPTHVPTPVPTSVPTAVPTAAPIPTPPTITYIPPISSLFRKEEHRCWVITGVYNKSPPAIITNTRYHSITMAVNQPKETYALFVHRRRMGSLKKVIQELSLGSPSGALPLEPKEEGIGIKFLLTFGKVMRRYGSARLVRLYQQQLHQQQLQQPQPQPQPQHQQNDALLSFLEDNNNNDEQLHHFLNDE
jgi:hypothetical protein